MTDWLSGDGMKAMDVDSALEVLATERRRVHELERKVAEGTSTVRSKDRSLSMTFDGRGELTSMAFNGAKYRSLAPVELAHLIVETLNNGRAECLRNLSAMMGPSPVPGVDFNGLATGRVNPSDVLESLLSPFLDLAGTSGALGRPDESTEGKPDNG